jgi:hypothetical protein
MSPVEYPLAKDANGIPISVPPEAMSWRVVGDSTGGRPRAIFDCETGQRLKVAITATLEDLIKCRLTPGRYRLEAMNAEGHPITSVVGYVEVPEQEQTTHAHAVAAPAPTFDSMLAMVRHSMDTQARCLEALASAFGPVRPSAPPQPEQPTIAQTSAAREDSAKAEALLDKLTALAAMAFEGWKSKPPAGSSGPSAGGTP